MRILQRSPPGVVLDANMLRGEIGALARGGHDTALVTLAKIGFLTVVPCHGSSLADAQHLPEGRDQAGDRHLNFHENWDNLRPDQARHSRKGSVRTHYRGQCCPHDLSWQVKLGKGSTNKPEFRRFAPSLRLTRPATGGELADLADLVDLAKAWTHPDNTARAGAAQLHHVLATHPDHPPARSHCIKRTL